MIYIFRICIYHTSICTARLKCADHLGCPRCCWGGLPNYKVPHWKLDDALEIWKETTSSKTTPRRFLHECDIQLLLSIGWVKAMHIVPKLGNSVTSVTDFQVKCDPGSDGHSQMSQVPQPMDVTCLRRSTPS